MKNSLIILCLIFFGCSGLDRSIEKRDIGCNETITDSKKVYLVNKSSNKIYQFTVKRTEIINDTTKTYSTSLHVLEPGDEIYLGCDQFLSEIQYFKHNIRRKTDFPTAKMVFPDYSIGDIPINQYKKALEHGAKLSSDSIWGGNEIGKYLTYDTLINGVHELYVSYEIIDKTKKMPRDRFKIEYEVTGQIDFKDKMEIFNNKPTRDEK